MKPLRGKYQKQITAIAIVCILALIVVSLYMFSRGVNTQLENATAQTLSEISMQQEFTFDAELTNERDILTSIAETLVIMGYNESQIAEYLSSLVKNNGFICVMVVDEMGIGMRAGGEMVDISDRSSFTAALQGDFTISEPGVSAISSDIVLTAATPIYENGEIVGVLAAEYTDVYLREFLSEAFGGSSYTAVVNQEGAIMLESDYVYGAGTNLFDILLHSVSLENNRTPEEILSDIQSGVAGSMQYSYDGERKLGDYRPIGVNNWTIVTVVPTEIVQESTDDILLGMSKVALVILSCFMLFIFYLMYIERKNYKTVEQLAYYDELTGMYNLSKLKIEAKKMLVASPDTAFVMVKFDFVNFKSINELFSFEKGDELIKKARVVSDSIQDPSFIIARVGTDEFMFFGKFTLFEHFETQRFQFEQMYKSAIQGLEDYQLSFRYGRYIIPKGDTDIIEIVNRVNLAHSNTRIEGFGLFCDYNESYKAKLLNETEMTNKMVSAMEHEEFKVYLQPKFSVQGDRLVGAEALVRWIERNGTMHFPNDFIPLFERNGFISKLDIYVLEHTCKAVQKWYEEGYGYLRVSVNLSRKNLSDPAIVEEIVAVIDKYNIPHKYIEIELTESAAVENEEALFAFYSKLRANKIKTSIDDFGVGYSSLSMLKTLPVDTLKMDRSFFVGADDAACNDRLIDGIVKLSHSLGLYVVAEGIETTEQLGILKDVNCDAVQGYFYSKPLPISDFEEKYKNILPPKSPL